VEGMKCEACAHRLKEELDALSAVGGSSVRFQEGQVGQGRGRMRRGCAMGGGMGLADEGGGGGSVWIGVLRGLTTRVIGTLPLIPEGSCVSRWWWTAVMGRGASNSKSR
jgi:hypothetical protein